MNPMKNPGSRAIVLVVTSLSSFLAPFMGSAVNIALPAIGRRFTMDAVTLNWVSTSYLIASAVFLLPIGRAADIYGKKRIFIWGLVLISLSSVLAALSWTTAALMASRVLQGLGSSMVFGTGVAILTAAIPATERGSALGTNIAATYLGLSMGPFFGGVLTGSLGWESVFLAPVPVGLAAAACAWRGIDDDGRDGAGESLDLKGSLIYSVSLVAAMYGFSRVPQPLGVWLTLSGGLGLALFICFEKRATSPVLDMRLMTGNRQFAFSNLAAFIHYSATFALTFLLSIYLQEIKGMSPEGAGLVLVSQPVVMMVFSPLAGRLSDRVEPRILASLGMGATCLGLLPLVFLSEDAPLWHILPPLLLIGLGFAFFSSPNTNSIMSSVDRGKQGLASGMISTMRLTGQAGSMGIVLALFAWFLGSSPIAPPVFPQFMQSMRTGFAVYTVLCALGVAASMARGGGPTTPGPAGARLEA
jgi:EmrB/QacA subfamily drug resistance transporter